MYSETALNKTDNFAFLFVCFLGLHLRHVKVPRLGVKSELPLPAYTTATATRDPQPTERGRGIKPATSWFLVGFVAVTVV